MRVSRWTLAMGALPLGLMLGADPARGDVMEVTYAIVPEIVGLAGPAPASNAVGELKLDADALVGPTIPLASFLWINMAGASEISRHFLPEPGNTLGLSVGAALLLALRIRCRRRVPSSACAGSRPPSPPSVSA